MYTVFEQHNQDFSDRAHLSAQARLYPVLFQCDADRLSFETASVAHGGESAILDGKMAVDRIVNVTVEGLEAPIKHTVQERFRRPEYSQFRDITITEWNKASNQPSELYKMQCGIFVYGYFYESLGVFSEAIAVNVPEFLVAMGAGKIKYGKRENKKRQTFLTFSFDALHDAGVVVAHIKPRAAAKTHELTEVF